MELEILKSAIRKAIDESSNIELLTLISKVLSSDEAEFGIDTVEENLSFEESPEFWNKIYSARNSIKDGKGVSHDVAVKMLKSKCNVK